MRTGISLRRAKAAMALLAITWLSTGCIFHITEDRVVGIGILCQEPSTICSCLAICEFDYRGNLIALESCRPPPTDCFDNPLAEDRRLPRIPLGTSYEAPADAWFALGSHQAGAASGQEIGFRVDFSVVETYQAVATYPPEFSWLGFDALGGAPVGAFGFDVDRDGVVDFEVPVLPSGPDTAYVDVDGDGAQGPLDVTIVRSGAHDITVTLPLGGDGNAIEIASTWSFDARVRLFAGVMANPENPGPSTLSVAFTSVDSDTGDADDGSGDAPASFTVGDTVEIASGPCPPAPAPGCAAFEKASLSIAAKGGTKDKLALKLSGGAIGDAAFGDPLGLTSHATCVYDGSDTLVLELPVAAGGTDPGGKPLWRQTRSTSKYRNRAGNEAGVNAVKQKAGRRGKVQIKGKGEALPLPPLPLTAPVVVQHRTLDGTCVGTTFETLAKNEAGRVKAKR